MNNSLVQKYNGVLLKSDIGNILNNIFWLVQARFLNIIISFFVGLYTIKQFGPERFGVFAYSFAFISFFSALIVFGTKQVIIKLLTKDEENQSIIIGNTILLQLSLALISFFLTFLIVFLSGEEIQVLELIGILSLTYVLTPFISLSFLIEAKLIGRKLAFINNVALISSSLLKITVVTFNLGLNIYAFAVVAESFFTVVLLSIFFKKYGYQVKFIWDSFWIKQIISLAAPITVSVLSVWLYMRFDQILIKHISDPHQTGIYATSVRLTESVYFIPMIIQSSFLGKLTSEKLKSISAFYKMLIKMIKVQVITSISVGLIFIVGLNFVIIKLLGEKFYEVKLVAMILILNLFFISINVARSTYMYVFDLNKLQIPLEIISLLINIFLNIIFIPAFGAIGCALSIVITQFISTLFIPLFFKKLSIFNRFFIRALFNI